MLFSILIRPLPDRLFLVELAQVLLLRYLRRFLIVAHVSPEVYLLLGVSTFDVVAAEGSHVELRADAEVEDTHVEAAAV